MSVLLDEIKGRRESTMTSLLADLHQLQRRITVRSLTEVIRFLESEKFDELTSVHIRAIAEYQAIQIGEEWFFDKAFTTGKEVAASLGFAKHVGREVVLEDMTRLRATVLGPSGSSADRGSMPTR
jgi:hypothetical protein